MSNHNVPLNCITVWLKILKSNVPKNNKQIIYFLNIWKHAVNSSQCTYHVHKWLFTWTETEPAICMNLYTFWIISRNWGLLYSNLLPSDKRCLKQPWPRAELYQMVFLQESDVNTHIIFNHIIILSLCFTVLPSNFSSLSFKYCIS